MTDMILYALGAIVFALTLAYGFVALNRALAARRDARLKRHLSWNGGHRASRIAAARRV